MLQVLHLDVSKVDQVSHLPPRASIASPWCLLLAFCCLASFSDCEGGHGGGWQRGHNRALFPSLLRRQGRDDIVSIVSVTTSGLRSDSRWWSATRGGVGATSECVLGAERRSASPSIIGYR
jgi:hypothetical protein